MTIKKTILLRTRIAFLVVFISSVAIIIKIAHIQFVQGSKWKKVAEVGGLEYRSIKPTRGNIYTDNGSLLATSLPFYRVAFDPCVVDKEVLQAGIDSLTHLLANFYKDKSAQAYKKLIYDARGANKRYIALNRQQINYQQKKMMSKWPIFQKGRWKGGVIFEKVEKRLHPFRNLAFRTVGFINENEYGAGLEYSFNKELKGVEGRALYQKTVGGNWKMVYDGSEVRPVHGYDIVTTIDVNLQDVAQNTLLKALQKEEADYGCVIVMEVQTGEIKAISNLSRVYSKEYTETYNYAVGNQGAREPGSTFKLVSMMALLEETTLELTDSIETGEGQCRFYDRIMRDIKRGGYGKISIQEAFEKSSNVGISKLVDSVFKKKPQKFIDYIHKVGLAKPLGFQMTGEGLPVVKSPKDPSWSGVTLPWMSIGYELKITPLQILTLYNAIANNGKCIQPIIVKKIKQANRTIKEFNGVVLNKKLCSNKTLAKLKTMLEGVVERGTARSIQNSSYKIAGKSGTAQKFVDGRYTNNWCTSFVGYFPAEAPRYSCIVVVDNPKGFRQCGSNVTAPVFKEIADKIAAKDIDMNNTFVKEDKDKNSFLRSSVGKKTDFIQVCHALNIAYTDNIDEEWVRTTVQGNTITWQPIGNNSEKQVPNVIGMTLKDALFLLENRGLSVVVQGKGKVRTQSLLPGEQAKKGRSIVLKLDFFQN
ncbi:MAG: transpeptidase family protein [Cytophagales bacterium]|nr:transpeptidase family protein [Cytophagales bacterium]